MFLFSQVCDVLTAEKAQRQWEDREMQLFAYGEITTIITSTTLSYGANQQLKEGRCRASGGHGEADPSTFGYNMSTVHPV